jgi:hypothetical protein
MKPIDLSRATFAELKPKLNGLRSRVHRAWLAAGPGTTRDVAAKSGIDILTFRPRSTELYQLGLLELQGTAPGHGHDGIYRARTLAEWENHLTTHHIPTSQLPLI